MYWILLGLGIAATAVFLVMRVRHGGISALYAKTIASLCFIATAIAAIFENRDNLYFGSWLTFGLILGMLGDIWLDLKWIYLQDKDSYLYSGFISFLGGHILFCCAIYTSFQWTYLSLAVSIGASLVVACANLFAEKLLKMNYGKFKLIIFLYTFMLCMTMFSAITAAVISGFERVWVVMAIAGVLFAASDGVLSGMYFGEGKNTKPNVVINHLLYYAAQYAMAATILCIK